MIDLSQCKPGDKLRLRNDEIATYSGEINAGSAWQSLFGSIIIRNGRWAVSRTRDGFAVAEDMPSAGDVVEILDQGEPND